MSGREELKRLELRRRELVLRSAINRLAVRLELQNVRTAFGPAERIVHSIRAARPWLLVLAPLAGILAARSLRQNGSGISKVLGILKWLQPLLMLWKHLGSFSTSAAPERRPANRAPAGEIKVPTTP